MTIGYTAVRVVDGIADPSKTPQSSSMEIGSTPSSWLEHGSVVDEATTGRQRERCVRLPRPRHVHLRRNKRQGTRSRCAELHPAQDRGGAGRQPRGSPLGARDPRSHRGGRRRLR